MLFSLSLSLSSPFKFLGRVFPDFSPLPRVISPVYISPFYHLNLASFSNKNTHPAWGTVLFRQRYVNPWYNTRRVYPRNIRLESSTTRARVCVCMYIYIYIYPFISDKRYFRARIWIWKGSTVKEIEETPTRNPYLSSEPDGYAPSLNSDSRDRFVRARQTDREREMVRGIGSFFLSLLFSPPSVLL